MDGAAGLIPGRRVLKGRLGMPFGTEIPASPPEAAAYTPGHAAEASGGVLMFPLPSREGLGEGV